MADIEKVDLASENLVDDRLDKLRELMPEVFSEGGIDFDKLRLELGDEVDEGQERYAFTWPGKADAIRQSQMSSTATLRPCIEKSRSRDGEDRSFDSDNIYIEGDNLEVLKLLQRGYHGTYDFIYIDPPYNTGHDFVYKDKFGDTIENYKEQTGLTSQANADTSGRFHSNWCSMIYPRLRLARELLAPDGVIAISIDDAEQSQLKQICDEIFGQNNFVACLVYDKNRKNDAKYFSVGHEYMLVYFKNASYIKDLGIVWRAPKEGVDEVRQRFEELKHQYGSDWDAINAELKRWYATWDDDDPRKPLARFTKLDEKGPYRDDGNISWPGGGGPKYTVLHPITHKPCKTPDAGWRFPRIERMQEEVDKGRVVFGEDETTLPRIRRNLFESDGQVLKSVKFSYAQTAANEFTSLFNGKRVFENPKPISDIAELVSYFTGDKESARILDFFSGSATTAHAVIQSNLKDGTERRFTLVQIPETCASGTVAHIEGFSSICELGEERIRRAGDMIKKQVEAENSQPKLGEDAKKLPDIGFRVFTLDDSGIERPEPGQLVLDVVKPDRAELDIVFEMMLRWGLELTLPVEKSDAAGYPVWSVACDELVCCMSRGLTIEALEAIADMEPRRVLILDSILDDTLKLNAVQIFKHAGERMGCEIELRTV
ncbi:site-specific DNA-methyltransferase [Slackia sp.]|uniref:site-specific DNA-methyltransferase n=1 Tax=Slackia sp. TaxID=2049041 RepID=UPI0028055239|nr:site-specific DNA-methyltransferase [Slackia sp.]MEE0518672.1 site-specific DNA-methyltransferase [Slackia sp.]